MKKNLLIFTYADVNYDIFVLPYITFALNSNPNAKVEIAVEDLENFESKYSSGIDALSENFGDAFLIRQSKVLESKIACTPNVVRFIETPELHAEYVYIGDIDLMILDDVYKTHKQYMREFNLPFSNIIRLPIKNNQPRLTGLHFFLFEQMYPLPDLSDIDLKLNNDEHILYLIMQRKGFMVPESFRYRPECGVHLSTNRDPLGRYIVDKYRFIVGETLGWQIKTHYYQDKYIAVQQSKTYQACFMYFSLSFKLMLVTLEGIFKGESETLHRYAMNFLVDKTLISNKRELIPSEIVSLGDNFIAENKYEDAQSLFQTLVNIWPTQQTYWGKLLLSAILNNNHTLSKVSVEHLLSMHKGRDFLEESGLLEKFSGTFPSSVEAD